MKTVLMLRGEIWNHYKDSFGFLDHCKKDPTKADEPASANGQYYMAIAYILYKRLENGFMTDLLNYCNALSKARVDQGLFHQHPKNKTDYDRKENIVGRTVLKYMFGQTLDEWEYAQKHKKWGLFYSFNNLNPNNHSWKTMLFMQNAFVINFCAGKWWGIHNTLFYIYYILKAPYQRNNHVKILGWVHLQPLIKRWKFMSWVERWYWKEANLTECTGSYFGGTPWVDLFKHLEGALFQ